LGALIRWLVTVCLAIVAGMGSALWMTGWTPLPPLVGISSIAINGWTSDPAIGSEAANPYMRAYIARRGLLGLRREEATYYLRTEDDSGQPLRENCAYVIEGEAPDARWWSVTLYAADNYLAQNDDRAHSIDMTRAIMGEDGRWHATIQAADPGDGSFWVSNRNAGNFDLLFRLYNASDAVLETPETALVPPDVLLLGCQEEDAG
jgi:hypothetical protein